MNVEIALAIDRVTRSRNARDARAEASLSLHAGERDGRTRALSGGARVFDLVTGQEGVIVGRTRENFIVPTADRRNG